MKTKTQSFYAIINVDFNNTEYLTEAAYDQLKEDSALDHGSYWRTGYQKTRLSMSEDVLLFKSEQKAKNLARRFQRLYAKHGWESKWRVVKVEKKVTVTFETVKDVRGAGGY